MPIQDDSTPHSADETLASRVESHRDRKVGKKRKVLANPNEETLQVISKFGGLVKRYNPQDNTATVWWPEEYCFEDAQPSNGDFCGEEPPKLAELFYDWDEIGEYAGAYLELLIPTPYPTGIVRVLYPNNSVTISRQARYR